jgi:hypothetical protein
MRGAKSDMNSGRFPRTCLYLESVMILCASSTNIALRLPRDAVILTKDANSVESTASACRRTIPVAVWGLSDLLKFVIGIPAYEICQTNKKINTNFAHSASHV